MNGLFRFLVLAVFLVMTSPALASSEKAADAGETAAHEDGAHHISYVGDDDHDGTVNWMDRIDDRTGEPNEAFAVVDLASHFVNLAILLGVMFYAIRRPVGDALRARALDIRKELTDTARERDAAKQKFEELETRLAKFEDEVAAMKAEAAEDAKNEEAKLVERAEAQGQRIADAAQRSVRDEVTRARTLLRQEAVEIAVELAQKTLADRVSADDQQKLARAFLSSLNQSGGPDA